MLYFKDFFMSNEYCNIVVEGANELGFRLLALADNIGNQITRDAANDAAKIFKAQAIANINNSKKPHMLKIHGKYIEIQPGNLKKHIRIKSLKKMVKGQIEVQVYVKKNQAYYGAFVERGTSRIAAQAFMSRAYESRLAEAYKVFNDRIERGLKEGGK
jgi:HK97 gp10 family phage protein